MGNHLWCCYQNRKEVLWLGEFIKRADKRDICIIIIMYYNMQKRLITPSNKTCPITHDTVHFQGYSLSHPWHFQTTHKQPTAPPVPNIYHTLHPKGLHREILMYDLWHNRDTVQNPPRCVRIFLSRSPDTPYAKEHTGFMDQYTFRRWSGRRSILFLAQPRYLSCGQAPEYS